MVQWKERNMLVERKQSVFFGGKQRKNERTLQNCKSRVKYMHN